MNNIEHADLCPSWRCGASCPTCGAHLRDQKTALSLKQCDHIIESFPNLKSIVVEGGCPFLWENLFYFCQIAHKDGRQISIITNGLLISKITDFVDIFGSWTKHFNFLVSLNGIGETHDISRGVKGAYDKAIRSTNILRSAGFPVSFSYVPFQENESDYQKIQDLADDMGVGVGVCYPSQSAKFGENMLWHYLDKEKVRGIREDQMGRRKFPKNPRRWYRHIMAGLINDYFVDNAINKKVMPCLAGRKMIHINPSGVVRPCPFDESMLIGKVTDDGLTWTGLTEIQKKRIPSHCEYGSGDVCNDCNLCYSAWHYPLKVLSWKAKKAIGI